MYRAITILILILGPSIPAASDELTPVEQEVWNLEVAYWEYIKNNNPEAYADLYAQNFLGWPKRMKVALDRLQVDPDSFGQWIPGIHENPAEKHDYELTDRAVRSFGDVVITHYTGRGFFRSVKTGEIVRERRKLRLTHTWIRQGGTWKIAGGMSAAPWSE